jgi:nifR3 family TIM-barrel protein
MTNFWVKLPQPFTVLAPMEGVTDFAFRETVATALPKPDVMFTEFTNVDALTSSGYEKTIPRFKFSENQRPIVAQIWGTNPENFYKSAKLVQELSFDGIDINMGCPDRAVTKIGAGAALIDNPKLAKEIIDAVKKGAGKLPISIKTRLGYKTIVTEDWISFLLEQKIDAITLHSRTAKQISKGEADWNAVGKTIKMRDEISPNTIVIGNGDIESYSQVIEMYKKYNVDGVMIGRGIFKNPWIFNSLSTSLSLRRDKADYINVLFRHLEIDESKNDPRSFEPMKKFFKMYINNFKGANALRKKLMETKDYKEAKNILNKVIGL